MLRGHCVVRETSQVTRSKPASDSPERDPAAAEGLSQFISKVLDQLNLSAWLPSAMLVGASTVLVQLHSQGNPDLGMALRALTAKPFGIFLVLLFALVLTAMVSQAFAFAAIRLLEGYWGRPLLGSRLYEFLIRRKLRLHIKLTKELRVLEVAAFTAARAKMVSKQVPRYIVDIHEQHVCGPAGSELDSWTDEEHAAATKVDWQSFCSAAKLGQIEHLQVLLMREWPDRHRLRPTRLGNVIRATEDKLEADGGDLQGYIMRNREKIPPRLLLHHDQFRTRLDMYCTLVFVYALLAGLSAALFANMDDALMSGGLAVVMFLALGVASYYAAISSAQGYCGTLNAVDRHLQEDGSVAAPMRTAPQITDPQAP